MTNIRRTIAVRHTNIDSLLAMAETRAGRQHKLEHFFREAYAKVMLVFINTNKQNVLQAFAEPSMLSDTVVCVGNMANASTCSNVSEGVMTTTLTRAEFADALGMREDDLFIKYVSCNYNILL
jgi:hypothetical protein